MIFNLIQSAKQLLFNNSKSGLSANNVQDAIDEVKTEVNSVNNKVNSSSQYRSTIVGSNLNNCLSAGTYWVGNMELNRPADWGTLIVFPATSYIGQMFMCTSGDCYSRVYVDNGVSVTWSAWEKVAKGREIDSLANLVNGILEDLDHTGEAIAVLQNEVAKMEEQKNPLIDAPTVYKQLLSNISLDNSVLTSGGTFTLQSGIYIVQAFALFSGNATGARGITITTALTTQPTHTTVRVQACGNSSTLIQTTAILNVASATTYHVGVIQTSGAALTVQTVGYSAVKLR